MNEELRARLLTKIAQMRQLAEEIKQEAGDPAIESYIRISDVYCMWAEWCLGEGDVQIEAK